ncbi:MAG: phosphosulfolactate synthase [Bacteroidetes bacterium]|nr:phosphosulfolactate synthase [Bacteroidota bacterium]
MKFTLSNLPERTIKPRNNGLTMMMDKGLSIRETEDFLTTGGEYTDYAKLGFGTSMVTQNIIETKIKLFKEANIKVYFGGTLFEAFIIRNKFDEYRKYMDHFKVDTVEVSDGSLLMDHDVKCEYIQKLAKNYTVLSEVGSKEAGILIAPGRWISMMNEEIAAGSSQVIAEARESGNVGIYRPNGNAHVSLVAKIIAKVPQEKIIWETPLKSQQVWFVKQLGANVNLGNIAPNEVIPLETLRIGLRGDTFFQYLSESMQKARQLKPEIK